MRAGVELALELVSSIPDPEACSDLLVKLKPSGKRGLISEVCRAAEFLDELSVRAFREGLGKLAEKLEGLSSALEALHDALLLTASPCAPRGHGQTAWDLFASLATSTLSEVVEGLSSYAGAREIDEDALAKWLDHALRAVEGLKALLHEVQEVGVSSPALLALDTARRCFPEKAGLACYLVLLDLMPVLREDKKAFAKALAELVARGLIGARWASHRGCFSLSDVIVWLSKVLKIDLTDKEVAWAVKLLEERGVLELDGKAGLIIIKPREEDLKAVMDLARERYAADRSGVNARLLSERFGWRGEYASAVISELVARHLLFPGPSRSGVGEDYYPPPEE